MLAGEGYIALDAELGEMNLRAQELLHIFNFSHPNAIDERENIIKRLFGAIGIGSIIKQPFSAITEVIFLRVTNFLSITIASFSTATLFDLEIMFCSLRKCRFTRLIIR